MTRARSSSSSTTVGRRRVGALQPRPDLWEALGNGARLRTILEDFYDRVYRDEKLAPFFHATTREWAIDHQYAFMADILTGSKTFFGDRPRNAHHWMVIDDALFDYREALLEKCLRDHGASAPLVAAWRAIDESFRSHIVKDQPRPRVRRGKSLPLEGYDSIVLDSGGQCDGCATIVDRGSTVWYHLRTGQALCSACAEARGARTPEDRKAKA